MTGPGSPDHDYDNIENDIDDDGEDDDVEDDGVDDDDELTFTCSQA